MPLDYSEMTLEEVLRTYSSVKGHRTRCERDQELIVIVETRIIDRLERLEKHTHKLSDITDFLLTAKYTKAQDHQEEVAEFLQVLDECANEIFTVLHNRHAAGPAASNPAQPAPAPARAPSKPSSVELKPDKLSHKASMASFRT